MSSIPMKFYAEKCIDRLLNDETHNKMQFVLIYILIFHLVDKISV